MQAVVPPPADVTLYQALAKGDRAAIHHLATPRVRGISQRAAFLDREEVDRLRPNVRGDGPLALLLCPPEELHDLPLRLVRLVFEWCGWRTNFIPS